ENDRESAEARRGDFVALAVVVGEVDERDVRRGLAHDRRRDERRERAGDEKQGERYVLSQHSEEDCSGAAAALGRRVASVQARRARQFRRPRAAAAPLQYATQRAQKSPIAREWAPDPPRRRP